jgi:hypothetical protein
LGYEMARLAAPVSNGENADPARQVASERWMLIRPYENRDGCAVRTLFIRVNRDLAPAAMRQAFETYIDLSLEEEIDRIPEYYAEHGGGFFVAELAARSSACTGSSAEKRPWPSFDECMSRPRRGGPAWDAHS